MARREVDRGVDTLDEVTPARIAATIWVKTFCCPLLGDEFEK